MSCYDYQQKTYLCYDITINITLSGLMQAQNWHDLVHSVGHGGPDLAHRQPVWHPWAIWMLASSVMHNSRVANLHLQSWGHLMTYLLSLKKVETTLWWTFFYIVRFIFVTFVRLTILFFTVLDSSLNVEWTRCGTVVVHISPVKKCRVCKQF